MYTCLYQYVAMYEYYYIYMHCALVRMYMIDYVCMYICLYVFDYLYMYLDVHMPCLQKHYQQRWLSNRLKISPELNRIATVADCSGSRNQPLRRLQAIPDGDQLLTEHLQEALQTDLNKYN